MNSSDLKRLRHFIAAIFSFILMYIGYFMLSILLIGIIVFPPNPAPWWISAIFILIALFAGVMLTLWVMEQWIIEKYKYKQYKD